jgi:FemAB-related protein (PEP-CTERM system-associated)
MPCDAGRWAAFVQGSDCARNAHLVVWREIIETTFGHRAHYLIAEDDCGHIVGILPLVRLKSWLFGDFLVSMPYLNYGGPLARDHQTSRELVEEATRLGAKLGVRHLEVRTETPADFGLRVRSSKVSMRLRLPPDPDDLWAGFPSKVRSQVRRASQEPVSVQVGREDVLDSFYAVFSQNMRDVGTPVYGRQFFAAILEHLPDAAWICCVFREGRPVAAGFLIGCGEVVEIPWASSLRAYNRYSPNMLLYWNALEFACRRGFRVFDFGRSSPDSGTFRFKQQWGAAPVPLFWHYWLRDDGPLPDLTPGNPRLQAAIRVWQHLPVAFTRLLGPRIVKNLP